MNVYLIKGDGDYFGASYKDTKQGSAVMASDRQNRPVPANTLIEGWYFPDDGDGTPVFTDIGQLGYPTTLLLRRPRTDVLRPMLSAVGTLLPMTPWRGHTFEAFICDTQLDVADHDAIERYPEDHPSSGGTIRRYAFRDGPELANATVFRAKGLFGRMFATDRFVDLVHHHGLTGLQVHPLWSSETGPIGFVEEPVLVFPRYPPGFGSTPAEKRARMQAILDERDAAEARRAGA